MSRHFVRSQTTQNFAQTIHLGWFKSRKERWQKWCQFHLKLGLNLTLHPVPFDACAEKYSARKDDISVQQQQQQQPKVCDAKYDLTHAQGIYSAEQRRQFTVTRTTTTTQSLWREIQFDACEGKKCIKAKTTLHCNNNNNPKLWRKIWFDACAEKYSAKKRQDYTATTTTQSLWREIWFDAWAGNQGLHSAEKRRRFTATRATTTTQSLWCEIQFDACAGNIFRREKTTFHCNKNNNHNPEFVARNMI